MTDNDPQQMPLPAEGSEGADEGESFANNYAMAIALGLPFGLIFGLLVLDNITWGILIGAGLAPIIAMVMTKLNADE